MEEIRITDEYIKLGQAMKKAGLVDTGAEAKIVIQEGEVLVNGQTEIQRGKKLHEGDRIEFQGKTILITR